MEPRPLKLAIPITLQAALEHRDAGRLIEAEAIYRQILQTDPNNVDAHAELGTLLTDTGRPQEAEYHYRQALAQNPANAVVHYNLGNALRKLGRLDEAERCYRKTVALKSDIPEAHYNLGTTLKDLGRLEESEHNFRRALALRPGFAEAHNNLGTVLAELQRWEEAEHSYRQALALRPDHVLAHNNLGNALRQTGRLGEAEQCYRRALVLRPDLAEGHNHLGNVLRDLGLWGEAMRSYRRALELNPDSSKAYDNLLFLLNYVPGLSAAEIYVEHREFGRRFGGAVDIRAHGNVRNPKRRIRVGYVSGDFRDHSVAYFIEPILATHNRKQFENFCYYNFPRTDSVTVRLKSLADHWRDVSPLNDDALANLIRGDGIDILVDLSGHTAHNRLLAFARKPAPLQATWLGYLNTTGLDAVDYRITDSQACPSGLLDECHSEKLIRLPDSQWCYKPPAVSPEIGPLPSAKAGFITFAVFTTSIKICDPMIELWSRLLERVPRARLLVVTAVQNSVSEEFIERFMRAGISRERLELLGSKPFNEYLAMHRLVDVMLDTFPYSGGTTTCHALWMGVPVVSLSGDTATSRGGASLLHAVGLRDLVAHTTDQYLDIAAGLAYDRKRLASLRSGLRDRMRCSPLMDSTRFTRHLEKAYGAAWRAWCERP